MFIFNLYGGGRAEAKLILPDGNEFKLTDSEVIIGREPTNDRMLADPNLSRHQARIDLVDGDWVLDDIGSTLGTTLNGKPVRASMGLWHGDIIVFGGTIEVRFAKEWLLIYWMAVDR